MRAERTQYLVPGWGAGELWTTREFVLAHDFRFEVGSSIGAGRGGTDGAAEHATARPGERAPTPLGERATGRPAHGSALRAAVRAAVSPAPLEGGVGPPSGTVAPQRAHVGDGSVTTMRRATAGDIQAGEVVRRLTSLLAGEAAVLEDVPLDLGSATTFQRAVTGVLRALPRGETVSYGELAALAGYPGAHRAVGTFCARNRFMFLVPCHRVVAADGIGSYGTSGIDVKRRLLALEGVTL